jgi:glycerophosphoryl diester phosphodiesterase
VPVERVPARWVLPVLVCLLLVAGCSGATVTARSALSPLQAWLQATPVEIAHRGGDADWPEGTAFAYRKAADRNPALALEVPVWRTADGVWVVSEDRTTGRVFDGNYAIPATTWATLSRLRTREGSYPMARLREDVLAVYGDDRVLFVDDKADTDAAEFLGLLDSYAGRSRYVVKSYWQSTAVAAEARRRGYLTWAYYDTAGLPRLADTQGRFDLLGLPWSASAADWAAARATGKPVIAHVVATAQQAATARDRGARGFMVSGVEAVVPHAAAPSRPPG